MLKKTDFFCPLRSAGLETPKIKSDQTPKTTLRRRGRRLSSNSGQHKEQKPGSRMHKGPQQVNKFQRDQPPSAGPPSSSHPTPPVICDVCTAPLFHRPPTFCSSSSLYPTHVCRCCSRHLAVWWRGFLAASPATSRAVQCYAVAAVRRPALPLSLCVLSPQKINASPLLKEPSRCLGKHYQLAFYCVFFCIHLRFFFVLCLCVVIFLSHPPVLFSHTDVFFQVIYTNHLLFTNKCGNAKLKVLKGRR